MSAPSLSRLSSSFLVFISPPLHLYYSHILSGVYRTISTVGTGHSLRMEIAHLLHYALTNGQRIAIGPNPNCHSPPHFNKPNHQR